MADLFFIFGFKKTVPTAKFSFNLIFNLLASCFRKSFGKFNKIPQPSPVEPSAEIAPR